MKKILSNIILLGLPVMLAGCYHPENAKVNDVEFRGHKYIVFKNPTEYGQTYVHDPDYPCRKTP